MTIPPQAIIVQCLVLYVSFGVLIYLLFMTSKKGKDSIESMISSHSEDQNKFLLSTMAMLVVLGWPYFFIKALLSPPHE